MGKKRKINISILVALFIFFTSCGFILFGIFKAYEIF